LSRKSLLHLVVYFLAFSLFLAIPSFGCNQSGAKTPAFISSLEGDAQIKKANSPDWSKAKIDEPLAVNDVIKSGVNSKVSVTFFDGSVIELKPDTRIEIKELQQGKSKSIKLKQELGATLSKVEKLLDSASRYEIETPAAVAAVRGSQMIVEVEIDGTTSVGNVAGSISVTAQGLEVPIPEGKHSTVVPGSVPGQPTEGTTSLIMSTRIYTDAVGDLFDSQRNPAAGPNYLDIQTSQISFIDGKWILKMGLKSTFPAEDTVTAKTLIEWNFLLDFDRNPATGLSRPFISNDIGYDYLVQLALENNHYTCILRDLAAGTLENITYLTNDNNLQMEISLTSSNSQAIISPPAMDWGVATIFYKDEDPRDMPSFTDKAPNDGHYVFAPDQTVYSALDDYRTQKSNPNGVWSYGWMPADFSIFNIFTSQSDSAFNRYSPAGLICWYEGLGSDRTPCIWINTGETAWGAPVDWLSLHPGPDKEPSVIRWVAPAAGNIQVQGEFLPGDPGKMQVAVRHNSQEIWSAVDSGSFNLTVSVSAGDFIYLMVYGGYNYGNTPVNLTVAYLP
jgi:hypothetical protein